MRTTLLRICLGLAAVIGLLPGCSAIEKQSGTCAERAGCPDLPAYARNRVYVFIVSLADPLCSAEKLRESLLDVGFIKVYTGNYLHGHHFSDEIERIREKDEHARFAIVSQGSACTVARSIAARTAQPIDLVVLLDRTGTGSLRANRILFIDSGNGCEDGQLAHSSVILTDAGLFGAAKHPQTANLIAQELCALAATVPVVDRGPPCDIGQCAPVGGGWDYLRPDGKDHGAVNCMPLHLAPRAPMPPVAVPTLPAATEQPPVKNKVPSQPPVVRPQPKTANKIPDLPPPPLSPKGRGE